MNFWRLERVPEPEAMDDSEDVASYSSAAAEQYLDAIDDTFVEHFERLIAAHRQRRDTPLLGLDVGTGPAQIPIKILRRFRTARMAGVDRSATMLERARQNGERAGVLSRLVLAQADGHQLPFATGLFSFVLCNSVLHHAREPVRLIAEIFRVASPEGAVLIRDLRRPARPLLQWHLWRHGRHYSGPMRRLFDASVRAAYQHQEVEDFLKQIGIDRGAAFRFQGAHLGIERAARGSVTPRLDE
jgi:ubiquinone/menaquinone biosynthesis C-methylase UbiE